MPEDEVDLAVVACRVDGEWRLSRLSSEVLEDVEDLIDALSEYASEVGVLGMASVDEDFFVLVRMQGDHARMLLSDITAVDEWPLADSIADVLDLPDPEDDDEPQPAGDLTMLADLGVSAIDLAVMLDDPDAYPDEVLGDIAQRLGFGDEFEALLG